MPIDRPHLILAPAGPQYDFAPRGGGGRPNYPPEVRNRRQNSSRILRELRAAIHESEQLDGVDHDRIPISVRAGTDWGVAPSLPGARRNDILSVIGFKERARLNVALDPESLGSFENAAQRYSAYDGGGARRPQNFTFFEASPTIGITGVEDLWASDLPLPEGDQEARWEVWLQPAAEPRFREVLEELELKATRALRFETLRVLALEASREEFDRLARSASIAQLRPASSLVSELIHIPAGVQQAAVTAAARRVTQSPDAAPAVCLLDTGITQGHPLLTPFIDHVGSLFPGNGADWNGHGTKMAGLALYEDLPSLLTPGGSAAPGIRLESVAVQAPIGIPDSRLPAERLRRAVEQVEAAQDRRRTFCFAMSAPEEGDDGGASSLSSALDALAAEVGYERLFCVPAGNLDGPAAFGDYQTLNETTGMVAPAQAWNALTVAACTDLADVPETHAPLAPSGDLSPWSRTGVNWNRRHKPPSKPDIVFEGGNQMFDLADSSLAHHADLCLLTTSADLNSPLALTGQTSAATAAIAGLCARLQAEYPGLWPETVRGLIVHSAEYSDAMFDRALAAAPVRRSLEAALLERFGYGRPDRLRAMENAEDSLTMVVQGALRPLRLNNGGDAAILGQMRRHQLPWPVEVLEELGDTLAELRITLSYFVEPNPGALLRGDFDMYASHGFDFDVKRPDESEDQAVARINDAHEVRVRSTAPAPRWMFGSKERGGQVEGRRSGLKHDRLQTRASDLARMSSVMVFPRKGWWGKDLERVDQQARYSLIMSIRTPEEEIYTRITTEIQI